MIELRINYNPFTKHYTSDFNSHALQLYNKGKQKEFDSYIRGIIKDKVLYLRLYYPFNDLNNLTSIDLEQKSYTLLKGYFKEVIKAIKDNDKIKIKEVKFNYTNDLLKGLQLAFI